MYTFKFNLVRILFFLMSIQVMFASVNLPLFFNISTTFSASENSSKKVDPNNQMLSDNDDSSEQNESFSYFKIVDQETSAHFNFNICNLELVKFIYFNTKHKVLFHPEFSTPPPKYLMA